MMGTLSFVAARRRLRDLGPAWLVEVGVALICVALSAVLRLCIDLLSPGALAFGAIYPICFLATLLAGWRSGLFTLAIAGLLAWYFVMNPNHSFAIHDVKTGVNVFLFFTTAALIVVLADQAVNEQDKGLAERDLLLDEINHRVKNNFQIVVSLLELQARRSEEPAVQAAMARAVAWIGGLARSHRNLYNGSGVPQTVAMDGYLGELCANLADGSGLSGLVKIETALQPVFLPRDRAVAVGIILNELLTNAFKHAFPPPAAPGVVRVSFGPTEDGLALCVADDGVGLKAAHRGKGASSGLGRGLIDAFARQAGGTLSLANGPDGGAVATLTLRP